ncbi:hypothetical protein V7S43_001395 [Phytophthora oleae]|uniref:Uncharacterized protein n=1 Tax=Phytophthora oleae TaxID=2107226 RepID=A0ABD3G3G8_9STRA
MKNHSWAAGIQILAELSSQQLGSQDVVLQPALSKVIVVRPGGKLDKQQAPDIGRSVATLAVILPSEYTGGDWVAYDEKESETRYDMGKATGIAAFKPHYVVYAAGVSFALEEVTNKPTTQYIPPILLKKELAETIKHLKGGPDDADGSDTKVGKDEILALFLSKSITNRGVEALSEVDRIRYELLLEANKLLPPSKQLVLYLACLGFDVPDIGTWKNKQTVCWYSLCGESMDVCLLDWAEAFNFLNPDNGTLSDLWGNDDTKLRQRTALVGWPRSADITNAVKFFGEVAAVPVIISHDFISVQTLRSLLKNGGEYLHISVAQEFKIAKGIDLLSLCRKLGTAIINLGDVKLVDAFFKKYVTLLKDMQRTLFIPFLPGLIQKFGWKEVQASILTAIDVKSHEARLDRALELADTLCDDLDTRHGLVVFIRFSAVLENVDGSFLGAAIDLLAKWVDETSSPEYQATLVSLASKRPYNFPDSPQILMFLQGPDAEFKICGFSSISEARRRVKVISHSIKGPLEFLWLKDVVVTRVQKVQKYEAEINSLEELVSDLLPQDENTSTVNVDKPTVGKKRLREEDNGDIVFE